MTPEAELRALFDAYRPSASDADRQAFVDDLVPQLRTQLDEVQEQDADEHELSLAELVDELESTPVTEPSFDRMLVETRNRFLQAS